MPATTRINPRYPMTTLLYSRTPPRMAPRRLRPNAVVEERTVRLVELQHRMRSELLDEGRPNSVVRLAEHLFSTPILTAARAESLLGVTRPTAHSAIDALVERGDLNEVTGRERGRIYEAPRIFDAVYGPVDIGEPSPDPQLQLDLESRS